MWEQASFFVAMLHNPWDLSFLTRDQIYIPSSGSTILTTVPPGKSPSVLIYISMQLPKEEQSAWERRPQSSEFSLRWYGHVEQRECRAPV